LIPSEDVRSKRPGNDGFSGIFLVFFDIYSTNAFWENAGPTTPESEAAYNATEEFPHYRGFKRALVGNYNLVLPR